MARKSLIVQHVWLQKVFAGFLAAKISLRILVRLMIRRRAGLRGLFDLRFNYGGRDEDHVQLPYFPLQIMKNVLFLRGLFHNNYLFSGLMKYCLKPNLADKPR